LDFSGLHPRMLYAEVGLALPYDPYDVGQPGEFRDIIKQVFNAMINAGKHGIEQPDDYDTEAMGMTFDQLQERIKAKHEPIAIFFFTGAGLRLQYRDSCIAEKVMMHFAKQGIPCLSIHDSFIVQERYARELEAVMRETAREEVGVELPVKRSDLASFGVNARDGIGGCFDAGIGRIAPSAPV
jgi:hypothetical protein